MNIDVARGGQTKDGVARYVLPRRIEVEASVMRTSGHQGLIESEKLFGALPCLPHSTHP